MLTLLFTSDYEIHGNGDGCPLDLMIEPTARMLRLFDEYGAKLTIMADVAEILKFKEYRDEHGRDDYYFDKVVEQLRHAIRTGHDVQLHLHSSYFDARYESGRWAQHWREYSFADLPYDRMKWMVQTGKQFLEEILQPVSPQYKCLAFRAANWSVNPSFNVVRALLENDITIDTSVFKFGLRQGLVNFDYTRAHHALRPWPADPNDICRRKESSSLWEFPIYSEKRGLAAFVTPNRIYRALVGRLHGLADFPASELPSASAKKPKKNFLSMVADKHAWKADFNQCSGRQLIGAIRRAEAEAPVNENIPFVLIGHSKLFTRWNERSLRPFLAFARDHQSRFRFGSYGCFSDQLKSETAKAV